MQSCRNHRLRKFPVVVERGNAGLKGVVRIYSTPTQANGRRYPSYTVVYYHMGKRKRERFNSYEKAYAHARENAERLGRGEADVLNLTGMDKRIYSLALEALRQTEIPLDIAAREYSTASKILGDVSLLEAVKFYDRYGRTITKQGSLQEILDAMLVTLGKDRRSHYHIRDIKRRVGTFVSKFESYDIKDITSGQINDWLRSLPVSSRTRDNSRDSVHNFFNYARQEGYLPKDRPTVASETKRVNEPSAENDIFTVEEMEKLLKFAPKWLLPPLVLKAFCGIRTEELLRLQWEDIKFEQDVIILGKHITKTKQKRIVPLLPNLKSFLLPYRGEHGSICARWKSANTFSQALINLAKKAEVIYKRNALRNSYISYRVATSKNVAQVSLESGNSPRMIQQNYLELVTEDAGKRWFSMTMQAENTP